VVRILRMRTNLDSEIALLSPWATRRKPGSPRRKSISNKAFPCSNRLQIWRLGPCTDFPCQFRNLGLRFQQHCTKFWALPNLFPFAALRAQRGVRAGLCSDTSSLTVAAGCFRMTGGCGRVRQLSPKLSNVEQKCLHSGWCNCLARL
jgi:hypothetical protein